MKYLIIELENDNFCGYIEGIRISGERLVEACSLLSSYVPKKCEMIGNSLRLEYQGSVVIINNYDEFIKSPYYKYFRDRIKIANEDHISITLNYKKSPNLISKINMPLYSNLANLYGERYGIDSNLLLAVMAHNNFEHSDEVDSRGRIGIMKVPYERLTSITYYDYEIDSFQTRGFSLDELIEMSTNVEAWCALFQNYLYSNHYNIMVALELMNEEYANTVFNAISEYISKTYGTYDNMRNYQAGVLNYKDINWLNMLMDDNGKIYSEEVLAYLPDIELRFMSLDKGSRSDDICIAVNNVYKEKDIKNT